MSAATRWWGPDLDDEQGAVRDMLDDFTAGHSLTLDDDRHLVGELVTELAELGVWTVGTAEAAGGGGAERVTTALVFERLGRAWPALGWASVQAHAAVDVLSGDERFETLVGALHTGESSVAVLDTSSSHVRVAIDGGRVTGTIDRLDAAGESPYLVILDGDNRAVVIEQAAASFTPLRRTGLGGAFTRSADIDADGARVLHVTDVDVDAARTRLLLGAACVAAGLAASAAAAALQYAAGRDQFGGALTDIPIVRLGLFEQAAHSAVGLSAALSAAAHPLTALAVARSCCDSAVTVAAASLQSHGGYGYLTEYGAERRLRDAISLRAAVDPHGATAAAGRVYAGVPPVTEIPA
ncbi:acyl-CoA dehydrogenase family protein [Gordonia sp. LSe1-13]|uniref:Acyl-CoA dehydrogenase family protein n=1 Tax=Gordonia sesuvii TaxID=3116777 RepID=A0ABU7MIW1_9ACTN|nr:acyl-CoA dehydrogenase family protein [Gordonia sp. LSe1-13]